MEKYPPYQSIFAKLSFGESQMLDKAFYEEEVKRLTLAFEQQVCSGLLSIMVPAYTRHRSCVVVPLQTGSHALESVSSVVCG